MPLAQSRGLRGRGGQHLRRRSQLRRGLGDGAYDAADECSKLSAILASARLRSASSRTLLVSASLSRLRARIIVPEHLYRAGHGAGFVPTIGK